MRLSACRSNLPPSLSTNILALLVFHRKAAPSIREEKNSRSSDLASRELHDNAVGGSLGAAGRSVHSTSDTLHTSRQTLRSTTELGKLSDRRPTGVWKLSGLEYASNAYVARELLELGLLGKLLLLVLHRVRVLLLQSHGLIVHLRNSHQMSAQPGS